MKMNDMTRANVPNKRINSMVSVIKWSIAWLVVLVFVTFLFTGELKSFYSWAIVVVLTIIRFVVPDAFFYFQERKRNKKETT